MSLKIAGPADGRWGNSLRARYESSPGISFLGDVSDVPAFLNSLDIFVLPSRSEGMSMALLEAMAAGLPIVATDVASNGEVLADGKAGVLVQPRRASGSSSRSPCWMIHPACDR